jgi:hypothetical protein
MPFLHCDWATHIFAALVVKLRYDYESRESVASRVKAPRRRRSLARENF